MTSLQVINLAASREDRKQRRIAAIASLVPAEFPEGMSTESDTGDLVAPPQAWAYFERVFEAFGLELPRDVNAQAAVGATVYLVGIIGSNVKLRSEKEAVYRRIQGLLTPLEQEFIDALFAEDVKRIRNLASQLRVLDKRASDYA